MGNASSYPIFGYVSNKQEQIFAVFDGIGGGLRGDVASEIAAATLMDFNNVDNPIKDLKRYVKEANTNICKYMTKNSIIKMGSTAALLCFDRDLLYICNIGDSKIFRLNSGHLKQLSKDHVGKASNPHKKPPLSQGLGIPEEVMKIRPHLARGHYSNKDIYICCTDGLTDMVSEEEMLNIVSNTNFDNISTALVRAALANGGLDNVTVLVCRVERHIIPFGFLKMAKQ